MWHRYVAVGDSFTEGLEDRRPNGPHRGWADRLAESMAAQTSDFQYANLAVRGRKIADIVEVQLPLALAMQPDLVSIAGGVNDALRPKWDIRATTDLLEAGVASARESGADVLIFAFGDLSYRSRALGAVNNRLRAYRDATLEIADRYSCYVVDFWHERVYDDSRFWADDRLHLNELGHERVAMQIAAEIGLPDVNNATGLDWREPLAAQTKDGLLVAARNDIEWAARHLTPWLARRIQRKSSGDEVNAKRPTLSPV